MSQRVFMVAGFSACLPFFFRRSKFHPSYFATDCFWQRHHELNDPWHFVSCQMVSAVTKNFMGEFMAWRGTRDQNNKCLYLLAPNRVRTAHHGRFKHFIDFQEHTLDFKRPDSVIRRFNDIVIPAYKPEVPVFIPVGFVAGIIQVIFEDVSLTGFTADIRFEDPSETVRIHPNRDLPGFMKWQLPAFFICDDNIIEKRWLTHRARFYFAAGKITNHAGAFRLAITITKFHAGSFFPGLDDFSVKRFAGANTLPQRKLELA